MRSVGQLRMSEVNNFIKNLVNQDEILADRFFIDYAAEVFDDDDDAIKKLQYIGGRYVEAGGCNHIDGRLFEVGEIDALYVEDGFDVALRQLDLAVEKLRSVLNQIRAKVSVYYGITAS